MKFFGIIGYSKTVNTSPGVFIEETHEMCYEGDILRAERQYTNSGKLNDDVTLMHRISIIADPELYKHCLMIRYVKWNGINYKVTDIVIEPPRVILTLGGVYNGNEVRSSEKT